MIITLHLSDGRKITQDVDKLIFFDSTTLERDNPDIRDGFITVNLNHVLYMHTADEDELKHLENHGW